MQADGIQQIDRAVSQCAGKRVELSDLPQLSGPASSPRAAHPEEDPLDGRLDAIEKRALRQALLRAGGNKSEAARSLGLKRTTFLDKLRRHGLEEPGRPSNPPN